MLSSGIHKLRVALVGAVLGVLTLTVAAPAMAHDELIGADPADGTVVETLPEELTLTFSGVLLTGEGATALAVTDADGNDLAAGEPIVDGVRVSQPLAGTASGQIQVTWRVVSSDGHPISGDFSFVVGDGTTSPTTPTPSPSEGQSGANVVPLWIGLGVAAVAVIGIVVLVGRNRPSRED